MVVIRGCCLLSIRAVRTERTNRRHRLYLGLCCDSQVMDGEEFYADLDLSDVLFDAPLAGDSVHDESHRRPSVGRSSQSSRRPSRSTSGPSVEQRMEHWQQRKMERHSQRRKTLIQSEASECTFQPAFPAVCVQQRSEKHTFKLDRNKHSAIQYPQRKFLNVWKSGHTSEMQSSFVSVSWTSNVSKRNALSCRRLLGTILDELRMLVIKLDDSMK